MILILGGIHKLRPQDGGGDGGSRFCDELCHVGGGGLKKKLYVQFPGCKFVII